MRTDPSPATEWIASLDAHALAGMLASGQLTSAEIVTALLNRIHDVDETGPALRAVIETNPTGPVIAARRDAERAARHVRGPLHGVPVLLKDNIDTADEMRTTAGSLALAVNQPKADAGLVTRLRRAGAVIIGKTNLSEWANFRSTRGTSGWSARGGLTRNPHALDRSAGGSSSGSAAAIAAGLAPLAVGTETNGSIVSPAALCGVVGIKPTVGLVPTNGLIPISASHDTAGPIARTVQDAAALLSALADPGFSGYRDYTVHCSAERVRGLRVGVPVTWHGAIAPRPTMRSRRCCVSWAPAASTSSIRSCCPAPPTSATPNR